MEMGNRDHIGSAFLGVGSAWVVVSGGRCLACLARDRISLMGYVYHEELPALEDKDVTGR